MPGRGSIIDESYGSDFYLFSYETFITPTNFYTLDLTSFDIHPFFTNSDLLKKANYNPDSFDVSFQTCLSDDGTYIPMTLISAKGSLEGPRLTHLYSYGGFGKSQMPKFNMKNQFFFEKLKGIYAIAHVRGGSEYGEEWYRAAIKEKK